MASEKEKYFLNIGILGATLGATVNITSNESAFTLWDSIIGITLISLIVAFSDGTPTTRSRRAAFSLILALCLLITFGIVIDLLAVNFFVISEQHWFVAEDRATPISQRDFVFAMIWLALSVGIWFIVSARALWR